MLTITVDIADALAALKRLSAADLPGQIAKAVADEVVLPALMKYPTPSRRKMAFVSSKQRKFFFASLKDGRISVPYRRSGDLGREWDRRPDQDGITLTSKMRYSDLVLTKGKQAAYFAGIWKTAESIADESEADVALVAAAEIVKVIGNAGP